jgi:molecular chaperone DnaK (HSP70)
MNVSKKLAIGIDVGSSKTIIAKAQGAGTEIILSESSAREFPNVISFSNDERLVCSDAAQNKIKTNFKNTIIFPTRYL